MGRGWVTTYADASFKDGQATWAAWVRGDAGRVIAAGLAPTEIRTSVQAELFAARCGIRLAVMHRKGLVGGTYDLRGILCKTDCKPALRVLRYQQPYRLEAHLRSLGAIERDIHEQVWEHLTPTNIFLKMEWVKGHQKNKSVPAYVNNQVDALARRAREEGLSQTIFTAIEEA